jgi:hypothetical protein
MNGQRSAVVVAHPAHLLTVAGLLLRRRPKVLIVHRADRGQAAGQTERVRQALARHGLDGGVTCLGQSETESYQRALAGDVGFHLGLARRVLSWLRAARADAVLGDAFEAYNFHHDLTRLMIDAAADELGLSNYEFPLASLPAGGGELSYGEFATGPFLRCDLSDAEAADKRRLCDEVAARDESVAEVRGRFDVGSEVFRRVPPGRDYARPPEGLALYYDRLALREVAAGRHERAISFERHFVPVARALRGGGVRLAG